MTSKKSKKEMTLHEALVLSNEYATDNNCLLLKSNSIGTSFVIIPVHLAKKYMEIKNVQAKR